MLREKTFLAALIISLVGHGILLLQNTGLGTLSQKPIKEPQVVYVRPKEEAKPQTLKTEALRKVTSKFNTDKRIPPLLLDKVNLSREEKKISGREAQPAKPLFTEPDVIAIKKRITLPSVETGKFSSPSYLNYYHIVREKIKRAAYQNYIHQETGEAYVTFVITSEGYLKGVRVVDEKSSPSGYLKETAISSVKDASPFAAFPKELNYPQLTFNVIISFEIE